MDGRHPSPSLMQGPDGNLYGGAYAGGAYQSGTIFRLTPGGQTTTLYNFCSQMGCADGQNPYGPFMVGVDGNIYGTTWLGGTTNRGVLFRLSLSGDMKTIHTFCLDTNCPDGAYPYGGIVTDAQGNIYGPAVAGGKNDYGTIFHIAPSGTSNTVYSFCSLSNCADGAYPEGVVVLSPSGDTIYGVTLSGGTNNGGTVFSLTKEGVLTTLYHFCSQKSCADGDRPDWLVMGSDGNFYGITEAGGSANQGTFFRMSPAGDLVSLYSFCSQPGCADGADPTSLIQATDGNFYGMTQRANGPFTGVLFEFTSTGALTIVHTFCKQAACPDGQLPSTGGLFQYADGAFYGDIGRGGNATTNGTTYRLSTGLGPFVIPVPTATIQGAQVQIMGSNNLIGATSVQFNGKAAAFQVVSGSEITATVPAGATSGSIKVVLAGGSVLQGNVRFTVLVQ